MNTDGKRNVECGMDIPISFGGGTVSFLSDVSSDHPDWRGRKI